MQTVYFFYGLAFWVMGGLIFAMPKKNDLLGLSEDLWLVGLFGLMHGLNEWVDLFILRGSPFNREVLAILGALLLPLSYAPLLHFGVRTLFQRTRSFRSLKYLWMIPLLGWAVACLLTHGFLIPGIVARYFICLPGTFLAAAGLLQAFWGARKEKLPASISAGAISTITGFIFYGVLSGFVVPEADFMFASLINYPHFFQMTGFPVQFFRMLCAVFLAAGFFALTGVYAFAPGNKEVIRRGGIKRKFTLAICGFSGAAILLIVFFVFVWSYHSMLAALRQEQLKVTQMLSYAVSDMISHEIEDLRVHESNRVWRRSVEEANLRYASLEAEQIFRNLQDMDKKWISAPKDSEWVKSLLETPMSQNLKNLAEADASVAEIFLTDRYGGLVAASGKTSDFYQADEMWWQKTYGGGKGSVYFGDVEMDDSSGVLSAIVAIPVHSESGEVIGVCKESVDVMALFSSLSAYKKGKTGEATLIDGKGTIIYHEGIKPLSTEFFSEKEMRTITGNKAGFIRREDGVHSKVRLSSFERLDNSVLLQNGVVWYLCVSQDEDEIFSPLKKLTLKMIVLLLISLTGALFFGAVMGERFARPILELQKATEKIVAGALGYRIKLWTGDEIQEFAESFNTMIERLREKQEKLIEAKMEVEELSRGLEKKVEVRTKELVESQRVTQSILADLTRAKNEIQKSEEKMRSITDAAQDAILMMDPRGNISFWNPAAERIFGYSAAEVLGKDLHQLLAPSRFHNAYAAAFPEFLRAGKGAALGKTLELAAIRRDGVEISVALSLSAIHREDGWYAIGLLRDITESKRMEDDLKKNMLELETQSWGLQKANDGVKVLYQELEKKNAELAKVNQLKDDFVSVVAHELRGPLGTIRDAAELLLENLAGEVTAEQRKYVEMVKRTGDRLLRVSNDLLDLAKIEAGKIVVNFEPMDFLSVVRQSCEGIALRASKKGITVSQDLPEGKLEIAGDFDKLLQVMTNLLNNAFKFTEKGGITVVVKDLGEEVQCAVKDTGPGIHQENLSRLFNKFVQFGKPTTAAEKGSGLGLVITKSFVEAHDGRIWVESEPGKGTSFIFSLPKQQKKGRLLGEILLEQKVLTPEQLEQALRRQTGQEP